MVARKTTGNPRKAEILWIEWSDSRLVARGWTPIEKALAQRGTVKCYSVGIVIANDKKGVVLAATTNEGDVAGVTIIPRHAILRVKKLR